MCLICFYILSSPSAPLINPCGAIYTALYTLFRYQAQKKKRFSSTVCLPVSKYFVFSIILLLLCMIHSLIVLSKNRYMILCALLIDIWRWVKTKNNQKRAKYVSVNLYCELTHHTQGTGKLGDDESSTEHREYLLTAVKVGNVSCWYCSPQVTFIIVFSTLPATTKATFPFFSLLLVFLCFLYTFIIIFFSFFLFCLERLLPLFFKSCWRVKLRWFLW